MIVPGQRVRRESESIWSELTIIPPIHPLRNHRATKRVGSEEYQELVSLQSELVDERYMMYWTVTLLSRYG